MRILVLAQKGDWTACESALKALERSALDEGGSKHPLSGISDNVRDISKQSTYQTTVPDLFRLLATRL